MIFRAPITYDDCLQTWLNGTRMEVPAPRHRQVPGAVPVRTAAVGYIRDLDRYTRNVFVSPVASAGNGPQGPNAFEVCVGYSDSPDTNVALAGEIHHHDDSIGIGEHWKLTGTPSLTAFFASCVLPMADYNRDTLFRGRVDLAVWPGALAREGNEMPVMLDDIGLPVACPVRGTMIPEATAPHEGTIILPDGSYFTEVYRARFTQRSGNERANYVAEFGEPISALSRTAPRAARNMTPTIAGALALASTIAVIARGK